MMQIDMFCMEIFFYIHVSRRPAALFFLEGVRRSVRGEVLTSVV